MSLFYITFHQNNIQSQDRVWRKTVQLCIRTCLCSLGKGAIDVMEAPPRALNPAIPFLASCPGSQIHLATAQKELCELIFGIGGE